MYEFTGTVAEICDVQTFNSGFSKRELIVREEQGEWPRCITFNFKREAGIAKLDGIAVGDRVTVSFVLDGREWTDPRTNKVRHFSDLEGQGVAVISAASRPVAVVSGPQIGLDDETDMPF